MQNKIAMRHASFVLVATLLCVCMHHRASAQVLFNVKPIRAAGLPLEVSHTGEG